MKHIQSSQGQAQTCTTLWTHVLLFFFYLHILFYFQAVKDKAKEEDNLFKPSGQVVENMLRQEGNTDILPPPQSLQQTFNRARKASRPPNPTSLDFVLDAEFIPGNFLLVDLDSNTSRHLIFATPQQLQILGRARQWFIDATFKVISRPFYQLFSIHAFIRSGQCAKQVPLAFAIMSRRVTQDYVAVLEAVKSALPAEPAVECVTADFESAAWQAVRRVFPDVRIRGCGFHWAQAVERRIQQQGLQQEYRDTSGPIRNTLRQLLQLPYLPAADVEDAFDTLEEKAGELSDVRVMDVFDYVRSTWMSSNMWPIDTWCQYYRAVRTNNDLEGWHRRFHTRTGDNLPLYLLIQSLHQEASLLTVQVQLVQEQKLTRRRREYTKRRDRELLAAWEDYSEGDMQPVDLLKRLAKV